MVQIGDVIVFHDGKIYKIIEEFTKDYGFGPQAYYLLKQSPLYNDTKNTQTFVLKDKINEISRYLISESEANRLLALYPSLETMWINDSKLRKNTFIEICKSTDPLKLLQLIKSLIKRNEELNLVNKTLTITDKTMLDRLEKDITIEFAISLKKSIEEIRNLFNFSLR